jgi:hypothetical protein
MLSKMSRADGTIARPSLCSGYTLCHMRVVTMSRLEDVSPIGVGTTRDSRNGLLVPMPCIRP